MKIILALCLFGVALAAPQFEQQLERRDPIKIIRSDVSPVEGANFRYAYETENGIVVEKEGTTGSEGQSNMVGSFSFPLDDGTIATFTYVADENGYQPQSDLIPVPPPLPAHAIEQIALAAELRAQGVDWDEQGFRI